MKNNEIVLGTVLGVAAAVLSLLALLIDASPFGLAAGVCAVGATIMLVRSAETKTSAVSDSASTDEELEASLAEQIQARLAAEERVAELEADAQAEHDRRAISRTPPKEAEALRESETGLFSEAYFGVAVSMRIAAARRHLRPVALAMVDIVSGGRTDDPVSADPVIVADKIRSTLREADTACRMNDGRFAIMLEDTPESGAVWTIERVRRAIAEDHPDLTLWAGLACYPAHAFDADEVVNRASAALSAARDWRQDRIEVAVVD